jgi:hypothetical protein
MRELLMGNTLMRINKNYTISEIDFGDWSNYDDGKYVKGNYFLTAEDFTPRTSIHPTNEIVWTLFEKRGIVISAISSFNYRTFSPPFKWANSIIDSRGN